MTVAEIAIVDLWTDSNRGDNALQLSLIGMLRRRYPGARITGVFRFGTNELAAARSEIASTAGELDVVVGGVRRTYYAAPNTGRFGHRARQLSSLWSFVEAFVCTWLFARLGTRSRHLVGTARYASLRAVKEADLVVWKGKNFREYQGLAGVTRAMTLGGAGYFAGCVRSRVHCVNASFWPITQRVPRFLYRRAFRRCRSVSVRDDSSLENARALFGDSLAVHYWPDLSFDLLADPESVAGAELTGTKAWDVAITVTAWGSAHEQAQYVGAVATAVSRLEALGARRCVIVPQVTRRAETNGGVVAALKKRLEAESLDVDEMTAEPSIAALLTTYARSRMLIGTRMHSCVFARAVGVPFVALCYDVGPKWEVLSSFWEDDFILDYRADALVLSAACERVWKDGEALVESSQARWQACVDGAPGNVASLDG